MMYILGGLITWVIILLLVWHDYETDNKFISDLPEVIMLGGMLGGILSALWPITWIVFTMIMLTRLGYRGYRTYKGNSIVDG